MTKSLTRQLVLSTALLGMIAGSAWAADPEPVTDGLLFAAVFGVSVGAQDAQAFDPFEDPDINEGTDLTFAGQGAVNIPLGEMLSVQLDGQTELYDRGGDNKDDATSASMMGGHLSLRDPGMGLVGLFAGVGLGTSLDDSDDGEGLGFLAGAEAQAYLGNFTLYGQVGFGDFVVDDDDPDGEGFVDGWFAGAEARYFIHEDFMLNASVAYGETDSVEDGDQAGRFWNWGAGAKLRLTDSMPIYGTLDYRGGFYDSYENEDEIEEHAVLVGLAFAFGAPSLMENDRRGATLTTPMLPARVAAWTEALD